MKRYLLTAPALALVIAMYLGILFVLLRATLYVDALPGGVWHVLARAGELFLGIGLLLGGTIVATHVAAWLFRQETVTSD